MSKSVALVFCKKPVPGRVKTRLASDIGDEAACAVYAASLRCCVQIALDGAADETRLWIDRAEDQDWFEAAFPGLPTGVQRGADLGERMSSAVDDALAGGARKVLILGSDSPTLPPSHVTAAFGKLDRRDAVLGPTRDGGYYLIAVKRSRPELFRGVAWSTNQVFEQTLARLEATGATYGLLPPLNDLDTLDDLRLLRDELIEFKTPSPRQRDLLRQMDCALLGK